MLILQDSNILLVLLYDVNERCVIETCKLDVSRVFIVQLMFSRSVSKP